jgi:hypothetical protein
MFFHTYIIELMLGTPGRIRTCDLELRSLLLYPTELPGRKTRRRRAMINSQLSIFNELTMTNDQ